MVPSILLLLARLAQLAVPSSRTLPLFRHGELGYPCIRTPAIVKTNASLIAFAGTRCGAGDGCYPDDGKTVDHMDTVMKRSTDNGRTWSPLRVIYSATCDDRDHGTPAFDRSRNRIVLVFRGKGRLTWTMHSSDDGETWSEPKTVPLDDYNQSRVSPGRGLQLSDRHPYAPGRLIFVAQVGTGRSTLGDVVYYTDDGGATWDRSPTIIKDGNEAQIVELMNGTLLMNARIEVSGVVRERLFATSDDGGETWSQGTLRRDLLAASCMGSFLAVPGQSAQQQLLLYSHPASLEGRVNGTVWASSDEGTTFAPRFAVSLDDPSTPFAYSCMSDTFEPRITGLAYETGAAGCRGPSCQILFTTFRHHG